MEPARVLVEEHPSSEQQHERHAGFEPEGPEPPPRPRRVADAERSLAWHQRFSVRVALGAGGSVGLGVLVSMILSGLTMHRAMMNAERERVRSSATLLAAGVQGSVAVNDIDAVRTYVDAFVFSSAAIEVIEVRNAKGDLLSEWHRPGAGRAGHSIIAEEVPLRGAARAGSLGAVRLGISSERVETILDQLWSSVLASSLLACALAIAGTAMLVRQIGRSIREVAHSAKAIAYLDNRSAALPNSTRDEIGQLAVSFRSMQVALQELSDKAKAVAHGDLSVRIDVEGDIARSFRTMIDNLRETVRQMAEAANQVSNASSQIQIASEEQEVAAQQQSASVEAVRRTVDSLLEAASHISDSAQGVLANAERTRTTTDVMASKISELGRHTGRITEILEVIREIADRSDLLALNASIEATRAGEGGRSFGLVAAEMRRLAERVTASVQDVKGLVEDIRSFSASTVMATEEARKLAESTTESARQITMVTQQQKTGTQQVTESVKDIAAILGASVTASQQTRTLADDLNTQATLLAQVVGRFRLEESDRA